MADVSAWALATFKAAVDRYRSVAEVERKAKDRLRLIHTEVKLAADRGRTYVSSQYKAPNYRCPTTAYQYLVDLAGLFDDTDLERIVDFYAMVDISIAAYRTSTRRSDRKTGRFRWGEPRSRLGPCRS